MRGGVWLYEQAVGGWVVGCQEMKPRKHGLLFREGVELVLAMALVVLPTWVSAAGSPMPVLIAVSLVHVIQVAAGVDRTSSRHLLLGTAFVLDVAGIASEIYDNYANFTEAGAEPERTTRALYVLLVLALFLGFNVYRYVTIEGEHEESFERTDKYTVLTGASPQTYHQPTRFEADPRTVVALSMR